MVKAVFPDWKSSFNFIVLHDGSVIGRNCRGSWEKLSNFASGIIRAKLFYQVTIKNQVY